MKPALLSAGLETSGTAMPDIPGGYALIADAIKRGLTPSATFEELRSAGVPVDEPAVLAKWLNTYRGIAGREAASLRPTNRRPFPNEYVPWETNNPGQYVEQVEVEVRNRKTGEIYSIPYTSGPNDEPMVIQDAIDEAIEEYSSGEAQENYDEEVLGARSVGSYFTIPLAASLGP